MTAATALPLPRWLAEEVRATSESEVIGQSVHVNRQWWVERLADTPFVSEIFDAPRDHVTRAQLFALGDRAADSPDDARRLLWATLAWGTGRRHRNNHARVRALARGGHALGELLRSAAGIARADPEAAYAALRSPYRNAVSHLGPPFFTKFLYFAGGGSADHPCLILDSLVAKSLRNDCGWTSLTGRYTWSAREYGDYCALLTRWAGELGQSVPGEAGRPDQFEFTLFRRGRRL